MHAVPDPMAVDSSLRWFSSVPLISKPPVNDTKLSQDSSRLTSTAADSSEPAPFPPPVPSRLLPPQEYRRQAHFDQRISRRPKSPDPTW